jgi:alkaline phosphatase D
VPLAKVPKLHTAAAAARIPSPDEGATEWFHAHGEGTPGDCESGGHCPHLPYAILILILIALAGCGPARDQTVTEPPSDPLPYAPIVVPETTTHWQGEMAGEVTQDSVILQGRLTLDGHVHGTDVMGRAGVGVFALSTDEQFQSAFRTRWMVASAEGDYIVKAWVDGLEAGTRYYYRLLSGPDLDSLEAGPTGTFRTLDGKGVGRQVSLVVVTGINRFAFQALALKNLAVEDLRLGFPALAAIASHEPDFFVGTGDNVYYDSPFIRRAATREAMRAKWHRQFAAPRFAELFQHVPTYWEKDDHDFRYDDADPYGPAEPSAELGAEIFLEQVPVAGPGEEDPRTYRIHRINDLVQIWLLEVRDHRDANTETPGPDKTMWGAEQRAWLQSTLLQSDATFKILISPTPMVGPDDSVKGVQGGWLAPYFGGRPLGQAKDENKRDNQTNPYGFKDEGDAFFAWLVENGFLDKNLYIVCGDKHWQYHSIHPSGFEEFSVGALVDGNSRLGPKPGDELSTDPLGLISQLYSQEHPSGGFLEITVRPPRESEPAVAEFAFYDEHGTPLYSVERRARR